MNIEDIKKMIASERYDFLRTNPHLVDKTIFLTLGGSHAYGTSIETTVYSFNKLISLLLNCNPNTIELLGCKPDHYFCMTDIGAEMISNRHMFLSQRAAASFGGYAT